MSLLRFLWRWFVRLAAAAFLLGAGVSAFHWTKYRPRSIIVTDSQAIHFSDDGNVLVTGFTGTQIGNMQQGGEGKPPIKIWDTRSGALIRSVLNDVKAFKRYAVCPARNLVAVDLDGGSIRFADWQTADEWSIDIGRGAVEQMTFSPRGDLLFVDVTQPQLDVMIDLPSRGIAQRFDPGTRGSHFRRDGTRWRFVMKDRLHEWNTTTHKTERDFPVGNFAADDRWFVRRNIEELSLAIYDADTMAEVARLHPALLPREKLILQSVDPIVRSVEPVFRDKIQSSRDYSFSPSGRRIATYALPWGGFNGVLEIWEAATGRQIAAFPQLQRGWAWFVDDDALMFFDRSQTPLDPVGIANAANTGSLIETAASSISQPARSAGSGRRR